MPIKKPNSRVKLKIAKIEGQGVDILFAVAGLQNLKRELKALGCEVSIKVQGVEIEADPPIEMAGRIPEAGKGTRTPDILLGKQTLYQLSYTRI